MLVKDFINAINVDLLNLSYIRPLYSEESMITDYIGSKYSAKDIDNLIKDAGDREIKEVRYAKIDDAYVMLIYTEKK
jgi:hypothetical protein